MIAAIPVLLVVAWLLANGILDHHTGQRRAGDATSMLAWLSELEDDGPTPATRQAHLAVTSALRDKVQPMTAPVPALPCEPLYPARNDPRWPHLNAGQLGDTNQFSAVIDQMGDGDA